MEPLPVGGGKFFAPESIPSALSMRASNRLPFSAMKTLLSWSVTETSGLCGCAAQR
jgi:hypothetical protein